MTFGPAVGNVGMYVAREMLISVPEDQRQAYLRMVEEISDLKYQLGVEVARQLPRLLLHGEADLVQPRSDPRGQRLGVLVEVGVVARQQALPSHAQSLT